MVRPTVAYLFALLPFSVGSTPCDADAGMELILRAVAPATDEAALLSNGGCANDDRSVEEECLCAALRLGWIPTVRQGMRARLSGERRTASERLRQLAIAQRDGAVGILARVHTRYPTHLKFLPAVEWAQSPEYVSVRVRYARYPTAEPLFKRAEALKLAWRDDELNVTVDGDDAPGHVRTSLRWRGRLRRRDGCADSEEACEKWAVEGSCGDASLQLSARCARSCDACDQDVRVTDVAGHGDGEGGAVANGANPLLESVVEVAWMAVEGGIVIEAAKATALMWDRLLEPKIPLQRLASTYTLMRNATTTTAATTAAAAAGDGEGADGGAVAGGGDGKGGGVVGFLSTWFGGDTDGAPAAAAQALEEEMAQAREFPPAVGALIGCVNACREAAHCATGTSMGMGSADCAEHCRVGCASRLASRYAP